MQIPTETVEEKVKKYYLALQWMKDIGIDLGSGRTQYYKKTIHYWKDKYKTPDNDDKRKKHLDFINAIHEINDFIEIHHAFKDTSKSELNEVINKLQKAVRGPIELSDETENSNTARNFLFEAALAAKVHKPDDNVSTILDAKSDTGVMVNNKKVWIECKRVTTIKRIEPNVKKAIKQLKCIFKSKIGSGHRGIVAIDVTKIINPNSEIYVATDDIMLTSSIEKMMDDFIEKHYRIWQELIKHKKIIATLVRFSFISASESRNLLVNASQWRLIHRRDITENE